MNPVQAVVALALVFVLPGFFLVKAIWPRHAFSRDYHALTVLFLSVVLSVSVTILATGVLAFLPGGRFTGAATGAPVIEGTLAGVTLVLASVAVARGAFPRVWARGAPATVAAGEPAEDALAARVTRHVEDADSTD